MENETLKDGAEIWQNEVVCELGPLFCSQEAISTYFLLYIGELWQGEGAVKSRTTIHLICSTVLGRPPWHQQESLYQLSTALDLDMRNPAKSLPVPLPLAGDAAKDGCVCPGGLPNANYPDEDVQSE